MSDEEKPLDDCACGNRSIKTMDHSKFCCVTIGFFTEEDWANIAKAAEK